MKTLFIVDYWLPFPSSEYGGVDVVIADNKEEALEMLAAREKDMGWYDKEYSDYRERIAEEIDKARSFSVQAETSEIVFNFHT